MPTDILATQAFCRLLLTCGAALLVGCGTANPLIEPAPPLPATSSADLTATQAKPVEPTTPEPLSEVPVIAPPARPSETPDQAISALLSYAERLRTLGATDLAQEVANLASQVYKSASTPGSTNGVGPKQHMQLALALLQLRTPVETARALALLQRVTASIETDSSAYKPLARLLVENLMTQRRLEDAAERQAQQLRESQRRLEQLTERLEAMRAIERSLNAPSPGPATPVIPNGTLGRPATP